MRLRALAASWNAGKCEAIDGLKRYVGKIR